MGSEYAPELVLAEPANNAVQHGRVPGRGFELRFSVVHEGLNLRRSPA